eukprot:3435600-Rhodomonas_salina.6
MRCAVLPSGVCCYAMSGTAIAYAATHVMSGSERADTAVQSTVLSCSCGTAIAYAALRCPGGRGPRHTTRPHIGVRGKLPMPLHPEIKYRIPGINCTEIAVSCT